MPGHQLTMISDSKLESVFRKQSKGWARKDKDEEDTRVLVKEDSPLHSMRFHRVILDEAHNIKV